MPLWRSIVLFFWNPLLHHVLPQTYLTPSPVAPDPSSAHEAAILNPPTPPRQAPAPTRSPPASLGCFKGVALATVSFQLKQKVPTTVCYAGE